MEPASQLRLDRFDQAGHLFHQSGNRTVFTRTVTLRSVGQPDFTVFSTL
ncbi:hypothetical protein ACFVZD_40515 [Streptomyces sp. NPDC058287]